MPSVKSTLLVLAQFAAMGFLVYHLGFLSPHFWAFYPQCMLLLLAAWTLWSMRRSKFNVFPDVRQKAVLVTTGPYRFIRHPMYTIVLTFWLPSIIIESRSGLWICWVLLLFILIQKMKYEEHLLQDEFKEYTEYMRRSKRLIPWVY